MVGWAVHGRPESGWRSRPVVGFGLGSSSMPRASRRREKRRGLAKQSKKKEEINKNNLHTLKAERRHGPSGDLRYAHTDTHILKLAHYPCHGSILNTFTVSPPTTALTERQQTRTRKLLIVIT